MLLNLRTESKVEFRSQSTLACHPVKADATISEANMPALILFPGEISPKYLVSPFDFHPRSTEI